MPSKFMYMATNSIGVTFVPNDDAWIAPQGAFIAATAEDDTDLEVVGDFDVDELLVRVLTNGFTSGVTDFTSRVNQVDGNLTVTIPTTTSGDFEDLTNTDTLTADPTYSIAITANGMHGETMVINIVDTTWTPVLSTPHQHQQVSADAPRNQNVTLTRHRMLMGTARQRNASEDSNTRYEYNGDKLTTQNLATWVFSNIVDDGGTLRFRIDGVNANQVVSVTGDTTGYFEDTVNSDDLDGAGEEINYQLITSTSMFGGDDVALTQINMVWDDASSHLWGSTYDDVGNSTWVFDDVEFFCVNGDGSPNAATTTESDTQIPARFPLEVRNMTVQIEVNSMNGATTFDFRVDGVSSSLAVSVAASTTGKFTDVDDEVFVDTDENMNWRVDATPSSSGSLSPAMIALEQRQHDDMSWYRMSPAGLHRQTVVRSY